MSDENEAQEPHQIDRKQCQAMRPNGYEFLFIGDTPARRRCNNQPTFVAKERKEHPRSMSICDDCAHVLHNQYPNVLHVSPLPPERLTWRDVLVLQNSSMPLREFRNCANQLGYRYFLWNGWVCLTTLSRVCATDRVCQEEQVYGGGAKEEVAPCRA